MNKHNLTKFCIHIIIDKICVGIVKRHSFFLDETVLKRSKIGHAGILWQLENTPRILLYKEIWAGCHHKLEFGIPWGDAGQGLKI